MRHIRARRAVFVYNRGGIKEANYKDKKNTDVYRLFCCVSCKNKETVFRTRDANSAVNMRKLTRSWMETQTRPR